MTAAGRAPQRATGAPALSGALRLAGPGGPLVWPALWLGRRGAPEAPGQRCSFLPEPAGLGLWGTRGPPELCPRPGASLPRAGRGLTASRLSAL